MYPHEDIGTFLPNLSPSPNDAHERRLVNTFSVFIESLDTKTLDYLRTMFVRNYSSNPQHAEFFDVLEGERMLRTSKA